MSIRTKFLIMSVILLTVVSLFLPGCAEDEPLAESNSEVPAKLSYHLEQLVLAEEQGEAEEFNRQRDIKLVDGNIKVFIYYVPGQREDAADAATKVATGEVYRSKYSNWVSATVPITSLMALTAEESISSIKLP